MAPDAIDLYWLPLGAGQPVVQRSGRIYEGVHALLEGRAQHALYHAALEVHRDGHRFVVELAPVPDAKGDARGVVCEGPVGSPLLGRWRLFRYELRCWAEGTIPDVTYAVDSPRRVGTGPVPVHRLLALLPSTPRLTWGRDELRLGEMWNSNSVIAWLLLRTGTDPRSLRMPPGGRAPGWGAGAALASRTPHPPDVPWTPAAG